MAKKNILLIFTDQQRFDTIASLGNHIIKTPVLDELVNEGVSFNNAYTPCPVCVPARLSMHTGKMPHNTGVFENGSMPDDSESFMEILSNNGYSTFGAGKMHFTFSTGPCTLWGFDKRKICDCDNDLDNNDFYQNAKKNGFGHVTDSKGVKSEMYYIPQVSPLPQGIHHSSWTVDSCIDFLEERDESKPFFIMASFEKPHPPFEPPRPWNRIYRGPDMPSPKRVEFPDDFKTIWNEFQNRYKYRDQGENYHLTRQTKAHYYSEISFVDYNVGRLFESLKEKELFDNTLIIYTADHGEFMGDYGFYGKRSFLDSAARIPMIIKYPGCTHGMRCDVPVSLIDILPTFLEFAGIEPSKKYDGVSLFDVVENRSDRTMVYGEYERAELANYMVTDGRFKYIYSVPDKKEFFFDHEIDPEELQNKAGFALYAKKIDEMKQHLINYLKKEGYTEPLDSDDWKIRDDLKLIKNSDAHLLFQDSLNSYPDIKEYQTDVNQKKYFRFDWLGK